MRELQRRAFATELEGERSGERFEAGERGGVRSESHVTELELTRETRAALALELEPPAGPESCRPARNGVGRELNGARDLVVGQDPLERHAEALGDTGTRCRHLGDDVGGPVSPLSVLDDRDLPDDELGPRSVLRPGDPQLAMVDLEGVREPGEWVSPARWARDLVDGMKDVPAASSLSRTTALVSL